MVKKLIESVRAEGGDVAAVTMSYETAQIMAEESGVEFGPIPLLRAVGVPVWVDNAIPPLEARTMTTVMFEAAMDTL